jgi:phosphoribosylanthranilate isomerase
MNNSNSIKLKVCGMRDSENILQVAALLPDYMGFIFYKPSKRYAGEVLNKEVLESLPKSIVKTGVFVNEKFEEIIRITKHFGLTAVQLHGKETPELCSQLRAEGLEVIKVLHIDKEINTQELEAYNTCCDFYLFDTADAAWGGTGRIFDWSSLEKYASDKPFFLSGGLDLEHLPLPAAILAKPLWALDINSRFEIEPGLKNVEKIKKFKTKL